MPAFDAELTQAERRDVILYLHLLADAAALRPAQGAPATVVATPVPAAAPSPALSGRLVFGPDNDTNLWLIRLPDEKPVRLTSFGAREFSSSPAWSPDGQRIAFSYYRLPATGSIPIPDGTDVYLVNADGGEPRVLAAHDARGIALQYPAWAPDGSAVYV